MAVLSRSQCSPDERGSLVAVGVLLASLSFAACVLMDDWHGAEDTGPAFSHRVHVEDEGMDCSDCHNYEEDDAGPPTMPPLGLCQLCHEEDDEETPPELRPEAFYVDGEYQATHAAALDDEVLFSHAGHVEFSDDCSSCHTGIETSERIRAADAITMDACVRCHTAVGAGDSCQVCHSEIDETWAPSSHDQAWTELHGQAFRAEGEEIADRCDMCHTESSCVQCHQDEAPKNHDNFWRLRGHSIQASLDRDNCATCHRDDFCIRCHEHTEPLSHRGSFGSPRNTHCLSCHFPLKGEGCFVCHKSAPSHQTAPPQPPDHTPGANCRLCHGQSAPLRHVDDGSNCSLCHR